MAERLIVNLGERSYPILFGADLLGELSSLLTEWKAKGRRAVLIIDERLHEAQGAAFGPLLSAHPHYCVPAGEPSKSLATYGRILAFLATQRVDRTGVIVALGGGVVGDLAGFVAATYLRGLDFVQVPTTLLAMVDSSVGGKTGINLDEGKNLVGAFHQPRVVFVSTGLLRTLPEREFAAGLAEVIKYGLLGDEDLFAQLERFPLAPSRPELPGLVRRCCEIKARIVEADERELAKEGGRALLNLGHTFGHAIEKVAGYGVYLHGEAVAIGLCAAAQLSRDLGFLDAREVTRIDALVRACRLPVRLSQPLPLASLQAAMASDKKVRAGALRFVILRRIGEAKTLQEVPPALADSAFRGVGAV